MRICINDLAEQRLGQVGLTSFGETTREAKAQGCKPTLVTSLAFKLKRQTAQGLSKSAAMIVTVALGHTCAFAFFCLTLHVVPVSSAQFAKWFNTRE
ncbi:hypothetical protein RTM1035_04645 [Roseovarius sp. TM1035]|nr:hypothetical protein RTM1035_04645 [Roseovarius sp. TM1035]